MFDRTRQRGPTTDRRSHAEPATIHRSGAPMVELALDLQRRAGNQSVAGLLAGHERGAVPFATGASIGVTAGTTGSFASAAATTGSGRASSGGTASVQREPCTDCPDAAPPVAGAAGAADLLESPTAE